MYSSSLFFVELSLFSGVRSVERILDESANISMSIRKRGMCCMGFYIVVQ